MKPEKYCKKIVKDSGSNFYYSFFFLSRPKRRAIYAIYAFSRVIDDIVDNDTDMTAKENHLAFWRLEIDACYGEGSRHPLTMELEYAVRSFDIPKEYLLELLNGVTQDMVQNRYATFEDLKKYCYRVASVVGLICLEIFEVEDNEENREAAINLGLAFQLTNILRDVGTDADWNRIYLPEEDIIRFKLNESDILEKKYSKSFADLMAFECERADEFFKKAHKGFDKKAAKKLLPAMVMSDVYYKILTGIKDVDYNVFEHMVRVPNFGKLKIALKRWIGKSPSLEGRG